MVVDEHDDRSPGREALMAQETATHVAMRDVTDEEVATYQKNGWVLLRELIPPALAAEALERVKAQMTEAESVDRSLATKADSSAKVKIADAAMWRDWYFIGRDDHVEPFRSIAFSKEIGHNAQRFIGRDVPVNFHADMMAVKMPAGANASGPTGFHQDWVNFPFDRIGFLTFWFALDEIAPDQGAMRFYSGSQHEGPLGKMGIVPGSPPIEVPEYYPQLAERYPLSDPIHLMPGDATVHNGMVVHGAPENSTDRPRWVFLCAYHPGDTCYTGAPHHIFTPEIGLEVGKPIKNDLFPAIYP
jgi:ectoine hydroxylase-related dioxygenase (phytanoyl-CoA dioxygenase family)